jgi:hypothetical protein
MKKFSSALVLVLLVLSSVTLVASDKNANDKIEQNLLVGLNSENLGLKTSSAYMLGEFGTGKSFIPLLKVLRNGETEEERISAAVALIKMNTAQSKFAVKQSGMFDESQRVRRLCTLFYQQSMENN